MLHIFHYGPGFVLTIFNSAFYFVLLQFMMSVFRNGFFHFLSLSKGFLGGVFSHLIRWSKDRRCRMPYRL